MRRLRAALARLLCPPPDEEWRVFQVDDGELHWFGAPTLGDALNVHLSITGGYPAPAREANGYRERILASQEYTWKVYAPEEVLSIAYDSWEDVPDAMYGHEGDLKGQPVKVSVAEEWARYAYNLWKEIPDEMRDAPEGFPVRAIFLGSTAF